MHAARQLGSSSKAGRTAPPCWPPPEETSTASPHHSPQQASCPMPQRTSHVRRRCCSRWTQRGCAAAGGSGRQADILPPFFPPGRPHCGTRRHGCRCRCRRLHLPPFCSSCPSAPPALLLLLHELHPPCCLPPPPHSLLPAQSATGRRHRHIRSGPFPVTAAAQRAPVLGAGPCRGLQACPPDSTGTQSGLLTQKQASCSQAPPGWTGC